MNYRTFKMDKDIKKHLTNDLKNIPDNICGIYLLYKDDKVVYVGQSTNVNTRIKTHLSQGLKDFEKYIWFECEKDDLVKVEKEYINKFKPFYNGGISEGRSAYKGSPKQRKVKKEKANDFVNKLNKDQKDLLIMNLVFEVEYSYEECYNFLDISDIEECFEKAKLEAMQWVEEHEKIEKAKQ